MDISGITQAPQTSANAATANQAAVVPASRRSDSVSELVKIPAVENIDLRRTEEQRMKDIMQVIKREEFRQYFAVSDRTFTIYKDINGQMITRFTSLRDVSVTYVPEPDILNFAGKDDGYLDVDV
jgi:hypothetical protein